MADIQLPQHLPHVFLEAAFHAPNGHIHAGQMELDKFPDNNALKVAAEALGYVRSEAESINKLRAKPDVDHMPADHDRVVRGRCDAFDAKTNEKINNAKAGLDRELARVETDLVAKAGLVSIPAHFDGITSTFHNMKSAQRRDEVIAELIAEGDHASLATLVEAPLFLTGLTSVQRDGIKERVFHKVDPQGVALRDHLKVAIGRFGNAMNASIMMLNQLRAGTAPGEWNPLMILVQQGPQIADVLAVAGQRGVTAGMAFRQMGTSLWAALAPALPLILAVGGAIAVVGGAFAIFAKEAEKGGDSATKSLGLTKKELASLKEQGISTAVTMGDAFYGFFDTVSDRFVAAFGPQIDWVKEKFSELYELVKSGAVFAIKAVVGVFFGGFAAVKAAWGALPGAFSDIAVSAANGVIAIVEDMVNKVIVSEPTMTRAR